MSLISFTPVTDGSTASASGVNTPLSTIYNDYNGGITNDNISASAAIAGTKIAPGAIRTKVGNFSVSTTGTKAVTGVGFTPKAIVLMLVSPQSINGYGAVGFGDSSSSATSGFAQAGPNTVGHTTAILQVLTDNGANWRLNASLTSLDSDGFTLSIANLSSGPYTIAYLALG